MIPGFWAGWRGKLKYHPFDSVVLTPRFISTRRTWLGGQFNWGGCLLKSNGGVHKVPSGPIEMAYRVQGQKGAQLQDLQVEQMRKQDLVIRRFRVELPSLNGQKLPRG